MTLLKDNNYKDINVALLSLEADIKNKITGGFDTSEIDKQLAEINSRIDKINAGGGNNSSDEIEDINSKLNSNSIKIRNIEQNVEDIDTQINGIEQKLSDIFSAENKVTDFNITTDSGIYYWIDISANKPGADYGVLLVNKYDGGSGSWVNQVAYGTNNKIYFRQNINSGSWTEWKAVAFDGEIIAKKVANALTINGKTYDGSEAVDAGVQTVSNGGTGATTTKDAFMNLTNGLSEDVNPIDTEYIIFKNNSGTNWGLYTLSTFWNYIKGKISSVLGLTKDNYGGTSATILDYFKGTPIKVRWGGPGIDSAEWYPAFNADGSAIEPISRTNIHAGTADTDANGNNIVNTYATKTELEKTTTKRVVLSTVTTLTTKYIKLGTFYWYDSFSFECRIAGNYFEDNININILCGRATFSSVCGYYSTHSRLTKSIIVKRGEAWNSNFEIYLKIVQITTANVYVTIDKNCQDRINISESTTAPSGTLEEIVFNNVNGMFTNNIDANTSKISSKLVIPIGAPSQLEDGCIWIER